MHNLHLIISTRRVESYQYYSTSCLSYVLQYSMILSGSDKVLFIIYNVTAIVFVQIMEHPLQQLFTFPEARTAADSRRFARFREGRLPYVNDIALKAVRALAVPMRAPQRQKLPRATAPAHTLAVPQ